MIVTVVDEREVGLALGAADYLVKPVARSALLDCLDRLGLRDRGSVDRLTVLAVDDEPAALALIGATLEDGGYDVLRATGGREALEQARSMDVDAIVCDLVMPDLDGFGVIAELKADARTAAIPIVICTSHDLTDHDKERLRGDIVGIVTKGGDAREGLLSWLAQVRPPDPVNPEASNA